MDPAEAPAEQPLSRWENLRQGETYAPNPFLAEITADGVNLSHLRSNPTLTPAERIRRMAASVRMVQKLRRGLVRRRGRVCARPLAANPG